MQAEIQYNGAQILKHELLNPPMLGKQIDRSELSTLQSVPAAAEGFRKLMSHAGMLFHLFNPYINSPPLNTCHCI